MFVFFAIAVLNLALGFAGAVYLRRRLQWIERVEELVEQNVEPDEQLIEENHYAESDESETNDDQVKADEPAKEFVEEMAMADVMPDDWVTLLHEEAIAVETLVEGSIHVLRIRLRSHLASMTTLETGFVSQNDDQSSVELTAFIPRLVEQTESWMTNLKAVQKVYQKHVGKFGNLSTIQIMLDTALSGQIEDAERAVVILREVNFGRSFDEEYERSIETINNRLVSLYAIRDYLDTALAEVIGMRHRFEQLDPSQLFDADTGLLNRCGLEKSILEWQAESTTDLASLVLFDVDRIQELNREHGAVVGDRVIRGVAEILDGNIRKNRNYDRISRLAGQRFLLFLGGTSGRLAAIPAERLRKTIENASFRYSELDLRVLVRCAVCEMKPDTSLDGHVSRLDRAIDKAKRSGGNIAFAQGEAGFDPVEPTDQPVATATVEIEATESLGV